MASGKLRNTKRGSTTSSYSSATTIVIFVGLSVLGLWLLTSNSFAPTQPPTGIKTPVRITSVGRTHRSNDLPQPHQNDPSSYSHESSNDEKTDDAAIDEPVTEMKIETDETQIDDSGEVALMDRVDTKGTHEENEVAEEHEKQEALETQTSEESSMTHKEHVEEMIGENPHSETNAENNDLETTHTLGSEETMAEDESLPQTLETTKNHKETTAEDGSLHQSSETTHNHGNEETSGEDGSHTQTLEATQNQITDEDQQERIDDHQKIEVDQQQNKDEHKITEEDQHHGTDEHKITEEDQQKTLDEHQITEEDQQRRIDEHQQQEDEQNQQRDQEARSKDPNGATSQDQIQHDDAPINTKQDAISSHETDGHDIHVENEETKLDSLDEDTDKATLSQKMNGETSLKNDEVSSSNEDISEIPKESTESKKTWSTQENQSENQKERTESHDKESGNHGYTWLLCNVTAGADYIPCLDNEKVIAKIHHRTHHEHRERHCPEDPPTCLVPLPIGYKRRIDWPQSRDKIWYNNVPHTSLAEYKGHQNWVKVTGEFLTFPGGGTQFIHGALHYIDFIREAVPDIAWGKHTRVVLDVGCGVASFGGYLFERDVLTMSFAPKDEHEAQVQFALERGIPAISAVMGSQRLPFPSRVFDVVHCARCRVPLQSCMHQIPTQDNERGSQWPEEWPERLQTPPYWLNKSQMGIYGKLLRNPTGGQLVMQIHLDWEG